MPTIQEIGRARETQRIDERIAKLQHLRQLLADPECHSLLEQIFANHNGNSPMNTDDSGGQQPIPPVASIAKQDDTVIGTVHEICRSNPGNFDIKWVIRAMGGRNFQFQSTEPKVTVGTALRILARKGKIKVVRDSSGRRPKLYANI